MNIVVDANRLPENLNSPVNFIDECFSRLSGIYPQHQFIYLVNKYSDTSSTAKNIKYVLVNPYFNNILGQYWWCNITLPALLKKCDAAVLVSDKALSLKGRMRQCLIVNKPLPAKFLKKADSIITLSQFYKNKIIQAYPDVEQKIQVIYPGISPGFKPATLDEKEEIKSKYSNGIDYFLYTGPTDARQHLIDLLKAFSQFKKWQKSSMQLLIAGKNNSIDESFIKSLQAYKYKNDVSVLKNLQQHELVLLTASAYAIVNSVHYRDTEASIIEAMQSAVPVIAAATDLEMPALYAGPGNVEAIAKHMITIYKDENKRNKMIADGLQQVQQYNFDNATRLLWQNIMKAIEEN